MIEVSNDGISKSVYKPQNNPNCCSKIGTWAVGIFKDIGNFFATAAYHIALTAFKIVVIPVLIALYCIVGTTVALSILISRPWNHPLHKDTKATLFHHLTSLCDELREVGGIILKYGIPYNNEILQRADNEKDSPWFIKISPDKDKIKVGATPILYAPGYMDSAETLRSSGREIANRTGAPVYLATYKYLWQSIDKHAEDIARIVDRIKKDQGGKQEIILMGHSMGGLATGKYISTCTDEKIKKVLMWITIGTPLNGTSVANWGVGQCAKDMRRNSPFLHGFNQNAKTVPSLHIYTKTDHVVPFSRSKFENGANEFMCDAAYGHMGVRSCKKVINKIVETVNEILAAA